MVQTTGCTQGSKFLQISHIQIVVALVHFRDKFSHFRGRITPLKNKKNTLINSYRLDYAKHPNRPCKKQQEKVPDQLLVYGIGDL